MPEMNATQHSIPQTAHPAADPQHHPLASQARQTIDALNADPFNPALQADAQELLASVPNTHSPITSFLADAIGAASRVMDHPATGLVMDGGMLALGILATPATGGTSLAASIAGIAARRAFVAGARTTLTAATRHSTKKIAAKLATGSAPGNISRFVTRANAGYHRTSHRIARIGQGTARQFRRVARPVQTAATRIARPLRPRQQHPRARRSERPPSNRPRMRSNFETAYRLLRAALDIAAFLAKLAALSAGAGISAGTGSMNIRPATINNRMLRNAEKAARSSGATRSLIHQGTEPLGTANKLGRSAARWNAVKNDPPENRRLSTLPRRIRSTPAPASREERKPSRSRSR